MNRMVFPIVDGQFVEPPEGRGNAAEFDNRACFALGAPAR